MTGQAPGSQVVGAANRSLAGRVPLRLRRAHDDEVVGPVVVVAKRTVKKGEERGGVNQEAIVAPLAGCLNLGPTNADGLATLHLGDFTAARLGGPRA